MEAPRFFRMAVRMAAYQGVLAARIMHEQESKQPQQPAGTGRRHIPSRDVEPTRRAIQADPILTEIISFGSG